MDGQLGLGLGVGRQVWGSRKSLACDFDLGRLHIDPEENRGHEVNQRRKLKHKASLGIKGRARDPPAPAWAPRCSSPGEQVGYRWQNVSLVEWSGILNPSLFFPQGQNGSQRVGGYRGEAIRHAWLG